MTDPALCLSNERWENFAQNVARGMHNGSAYLASVPVNKTHSGDMNSAKVSGFKLRQKEVVQARISWLIADERARQRAIDNAGDNIPDTFTRDDILRLFVEVSDVLRECYETAQRSSVPPIRLQQLRSVFADHTARLARLEETEVIPIENDGDTSLVDRLNSLEVCQCKT